MATFPIAMNKGDILRVNGIEINIQNQFILKRDEQGEYYEIDFIKLKIMIDKEKIYDFLNYKGHILNWNLDTKEKFITAKMPNDNEINLINYLSGDYELYGSRAFNSIVIRKDQPYNFRSSNIKKKIKTNLNKSKTITNACKFFAGDEIVILESYEGHKKELGQSSNKERNSHKLITLAKDQNNSNSLKYYEVSLNKNGQNGDEFSFLIDEADIDILSSITVKNPFYKKDESEINNPINDDEISNELEVDGATIKYNDSTVKNEYITINNPTWHLLTNQYIAVSYSSIYNSKIISQMMYIHRYLLQNSITDENYTIDHINGNKFDNRRSNLRAANMSTQNMNRDMVKRKRTLANIINSFAKPGTDTPINLSFDNLEFIIYFSESVKTKKGITIRNGFSIEFKPARSGTEKGIEDSSTQSVVVKDNPFFAIKIKLAHAICIRYLYTCKYNTMLKHNIDNKSFANSDEFKSYSESIISEIIGQVHTIDSFLDYMISLKIMKYADHRKTIGTTIPHDSVVNDLSNITFDYIQYVSARDKYDIDVPYGKDTTTGKSLRLRKSGLGSSKETITDGDKKAFALVQRYNALVEIESSTKNTLSNITIEDIKFTSFQDLRTHTETFINKLVPKTSTPYTLESFAEYITKKAANKKIFLEVVKLKNEQ